MSTTRVGEGEVARLASAGSTDIVELSDGDEFNLLITPVAKQVGNSTIRMLAYNGSSPGPTIKVRQGTRVAVNIENHGDRADTVHWHGLRLDNQYDGTHQVQAPIPPSGRFRAEVDFPDPGVYWYHPHIRSDVGLEMGLYGAILVEPATPDYWPTVHREVVSIVDDLLLEDAEVAPFDPDEANYVAMGRFGNVLLVNGETDLALRAKLGEVVRFYVINTANTRVFKLALPGVRTKLVGGDSGHVEHEEFKEEFVIAPSERVVIDALFDRAGNLTLEHRTPRATYPLAVITVSEEQAMPSLTESFEVLRTNADMVAERHRIQHHFSAAPDKTLAFIAEMDLPDPAGTGPIVYACPMHPDVVSDTPGSCPKCGMKLVPTESPAVSYAGGGDVAVLDTHSGGHGHHDRASDAADEERRHASGDGIEWEDDMVEINRVTTMSNMRWKIIDRETGAENMDIDWRFKVGDQVKIRLLNEMAGDHPMHHPFHIHGAGRFVVLSRDGVTEPSLVWKDTVLVRTGETVDILLDVTHAGRWMAHCHIAEHHENRMMLSFDVTE